MFYEDDPQDGTLVGVLPRGSLHGQVTAQQFLQFLTQQFSNSIQIFV